MVVGLMADGKGFIEGEKIEKMRISNDSQDSSETLVYFTSLETFSVGIVQSSNIY